MKTIIAALLIAIAIGGVGGYMAFLYQQSIQNEARFQCAQISRYSTTSLDENGQAIEVWYPVQEIYQNCLNEKGI